MPVDPWQTVAALRQEMVDLVRDLDEEQLATPSLCEGWSLRDVAGHVAWVAHATPPEVAREVLLAGGRVHRAIATQAKVYGSLPTDVLIERLEAGVRSHNLTPTVTTSSLIADTLVHLQDVRRPLGITAPIDPDALLLALDHYLLANRYTGGKRRVRGLTLVATDVTWHHGGGREVHGPGEALLLAGVGRAAALDDLAGDGLTVLAGRM